MDTFSYAEFAFLEIFSAVFSNFKSEDLMI